MLTLVLCTFLVFALAMLLMAVGVLAGRARFEGGCGSVCRCRRE